MGGFEWTERRWVGSDGQIGVHHAAPPISDRLGFFFFGGCGLSFVGFNGLILVGYGGGWWPATRGSGGGGRLLWAVVVGGCALYYRLKFFFNDILMCCIYYFNI